jgi:hypothetical protein
MKKRNRGKRFGMAAAAAALTTMVFGVSSSNAAVVPAQFTFDDAALNVGVGFDILEPPNTATMTGTIDDVNGDIAVPAVGFVFPNFAGSGSGIPVEVEFEATAPLTGTADIATGGITFDSSAFHALVKVQGTTASCSYDFDMALTTADEAGNPYGGDPFTLNLAANPVTAVDGALQDGWAAGHLPADTGGTCPSVINGLATGAGGLALGNGVDLTPLPPPVNPPADPTTKKKCKKGQKLKKGKCVCKKGFKKGKKGKCVKKKKKKKKKK